MEISKLQRFPTRTLLGVGMAFCLSPMANAFDALPWTLTESAVDTAAGTTKVADICNVTGCVPSGTSVNNMDLNYDSTIVQGPFVVQGDGTLDATFTETGRFKIGQYYTGFVSEGGTNGTTVTTALGAGAYSLWGAFSIGGTATLGSLAADILDVEVTSGSLTLYIDFNPTGETLPNLDMDAIVGSASSATGGSTLTRIGQTNSASGSFEIIWDDLALATFGSSYWPEPDPFHMIIDANADVDGLQGVFNPNGTTVVTAGQGNAYMSTVPEPASLALLGLGLAGLGFTRRRRSA